MSIPAALSTVKRELMLWLLWLLWKVRITKEIWVTLSDKAWWMHERCMTENDHSDFEDLIQHLGILQLYSS